MTALAEQVTYGHQMALHMAIGFLFLGGGRYTFSTSNSAVAALLCAAYPRFASDTLDNRHHLQALRHLWVLAAEPRCLEALDMHTGQPCCVSRQIIAAASVMVAGAGAAQRCI